MSTTFFTKLNALRVARNKKIREAESAYTEAIKELEKEIKEKAKKQLNKSKESTSESESGSGPTKDKIEKKLTAKNDKDYYYNLATGRLVKTGKKKFTFYHDGDLRVAHPEGEDYSSVLADLGVTEESDDESDDESSDESSTKNDSDSE